MGSQSAFTNVACTCNNIFCRIWHSLSCTNCLKHINYLLVKVENIILDIFSNSSQQNFFQKKSPFHRRTTQTRTTTPSLLHQCLSPPGVTALLSTSQTLLRKPFLTTWPSNPWWLLIRRWISWKGSLVMTWICQSLWCLLAEICSLSSKQMMLSLIADIMEQWE